MLDQNKRQIDVAIVGAGLSGIGAAYHIQENTHGLSYEVYEARERLGGTWDLFQYPGIRSDSDMYTLGFSFYPWKNPQAIADGPSILSYIQETAAHFGIDKKIQFQHRVEHLEWSSLTQRWTLHIMVGDAAQALVVEARFVFMCTGYYDYQKGHTPVFPNQESFGGRIMHPQHWDTEYEYDNQRVIIIGSGATAVTLAPELAKKAETVYMLQRSPTYIMTLPREDAVANALKRILPEKWSSRIIRKKNILFSLYFYQASRKWPKAIRKLLLKGVKKELGPDYEEKHFSPRYNPWDQRLCLVPDGDLFEAIKKGQVEMVTDTIASFVPEGIKLSSGRILEADLIVTATGLSIQLLGGMTAAVDGKQVKTGDLHCYKGVLFSGIPNFAVAIGYTNASWTLKCDLNAQYVARLLSFMAQKGHKVVTPQFDAERFSSEPLLDFEAGYIKRAQSILPNQGSEAPWKVYQNYLKDYKALRKSKLEDAYLEYE